MITKKLKIVSCADSALVKKLQEKYSYAFRKVYANYSELTPEAKEQIRFQYGLDVFQFRCLLVDVETKIAQVATINKENVVDSLSAKSKLQELSGKTDEDSKRLKFKLIQKIKRLSNFSDLVFGGKALLSRISFLSNDREHNKEELVLLKKEYADKRLLPIYTEGESYGGANRKFAFNFVEKEVIYKPKAGIKITINFACSEKQHQELCALQTMIEQTPSLPVSIRLSTEYICVTYDEERLYGFGFDNTSLNKELRLISKENKEERAALAAKYYREQEARKLKNKVVNRFLAVDLNPQYIGWCIQDDTAEGIVTVAKGTYDLSGLSKATRLSSYNSKQVYQNNKRRFELCQVWKDLFNMATHYKVAYFVCEELGFKKQLVNKEAKEANRKTRNIWHRTLTTQLIQKYCNMLGIQIKFVNPCYSSFIGNIKYVFYDPCNASLEICRRGITKFVKGSFYPRLTEDDYHTMSSLINNQVRDVGNKTELIQKVRSLSSWRDLFDLFKQAKLKYRRSLEEIPHRESSFFNYRSCVVRYSF